MAFNIFPKNNFEKNSLAVLVIIFIIIFGLFNLYYYKYLIPVQENLVVSSQENLDSKIKAFGLKIDKLDILVPVIKNVDGSDKTAYNEALNQGVAHYKGMALPGQGSNIFIFGHSSTVLNQGNYATIFARLNELEKDDKAIVYFEGKKYEYSVTEKEVVKKTDIGVLNPTPKEQLTLMTCWPIGTNQKRLVVKFNLNETLPL